MHVTGGFKKGEFDYFYKGCIFSLSIMYNILELVQNRTFKTEKDVLKIIIDVLCFTDVKCM